MWIKEPTGFNELFAIAKTHDLLLNSFSQKLTGLFYVNWRKDDQYFNIAMHEQNSRLSRRATP